MDNGASSYRRFLNGDDKGIEEIVSAYREGLLFYLNSYVQNPYVAQQLSEDVFFKLLVKKPRYTKRCTFKTWLYTIGRNMAIDYLRRVARNPGLSLEDVGDIAAEEESLEQYFIQEESRQTIHKAMARLQPDYREVLQLLYFQNFTNQQAACIMKKTRRQIETLAYRARQSLKSQLEKEGFVYEEF